MNDAGEQLRKAIDLLAWAHTLDTLGVGVQGMEADRVKARKTAEELIEQTRPSRFVFFRTARETVDFLVETAAKPMGARPDIVVKGGYLANT